MTIIIERQRPVETKSEKFKFKDTLGFMPSKMSGRSYMNAYHDHHQYEVIYDETMGWGIKIKFKSVGSIFKNVGKFISKAVKDVAKLPKVAMKVVKGVGEVTQDAYDAAKQVALKVSPPFLRPFVEVAIMPVQLIVNPIATVAVIVKSAGEIAHDIVKETSNAVEVTYKQVVRPAFRVVRNVANEAVWKPIHKVVDVAVLPLLPTSIREKLDTILDIPDAAYAGKLTDKDIVKGVKAYLQLASLPAKMQGQFMNDVIDRLQKDAVLGPFLKGLDKYSGGLLTSAHNLADMPDDIYHDRQIDWKARLVDALKIYLATVSANALITSMATSAVGEETGLDQTPLGRGVLTVGVAYGAAYAGGNLSSLSGDAFSSGSKDVLLTSAKGVAVKQAQDETIKEALKKGWVDDKFTAQMILSAGGTMYSTVGSDKTLMTAMDEVHDKEFQKYINREVQNRTGLPITYAHMVDIYNTDWATIAENVNNAMARMIPIMGTSDGSFLSDMGSNFVDEMRRIPQNFSNIGSNVLDELSRTPENLAKFAHAVASETVRTPENIAKIAGNIASASAKASMDAANAITKAAQDAAAEAMRAPSNVVDFVSSVKTPEISTPSISMPDLNLNTPKIEIPDISDLVKKYGPTMIDFLQASYGPNYAEMSFSPEQLSDIELNYKAPKKSKAPLIIGVLGLLAAGYVATKD
jgi:hypothetical protein